MRILTAVAVSAAIALAGCAKDPEPETPGPGAGAGTPPPAAGPGTPAPGTIEYFNQVVGDRVFFAFDEYRLDARAQETLRGQAQWLMANPGTTVRIEGHADERGTRAYNLALGARRANSVRRFLIAQGVPAGRLSTVTYGKERPVALCSDESCWSQNRRGVSVVSRGAGS